MFTPFNSTSLWIGTDLKRYSQIREMLTAEGIEYKVKTVGQGSGGRASMRGTMGSFGNSSHLMYQHEVFVYDRDLEKAKYLINR